MPTITATRFHNYSNERLADALGAAACARKLAEEEERELKAELKRRGLDRAAGERYAVLRTRFVVWVLDTEAARRELGEEEYAHLCRVQARERIDVRPAGELQH
jgi:hypothetical protein